MEDAFRVEKKAFIEEGNDNNALNAPSREHGHGFGLVNCKGIIEKYRKVSQIFSVCSINAESRKGEGCRFSFRLPKGIMRNLLISMFVFHTSWAFSDSITSTAILLSELSDSVYECNLRHDFSKAIAYADSALSVFNRQNDIDASQKTKLLLYDETSNEPSELLWFREERQVDYNTILLIIRYIHYYIKS